MARVLLTDEDWALISDVFPSPSATGRPRCDPRPSPPGLIPSYFRRRHRFSLQFPRRGVKVRSACWQSIFNGTNCGHAPRDATNAGKLR